MRKRCNSLKLLMRFVLLMIFLNSFSVLAHDFYLYGDDKRDLSGHLINAHGGGVLYKDGVYYWYGEYREKELTQKISLYTSRDLKEWVFSGVILDISKSHPDYNIERPKIIYNKKNKNFVMWFHREAKNNFDVAEAGIALSSKIDGPYHFIESFRPNIRMKPLNLYQNKDFSSEEKAANKVFVRDFSTGQMFRDMSLFVDDDNMAYVIYASEDNYTLHISQLNEDYTQVTNKYIRVMIGRKSEAPALFKRKGIYYIIASGLYGYAPTISKLATSNNILGEWKEFPTPFKSKQKDMVKNSFYSQTSYVFKLPNSDSYIYMADRWKRGALNKSTYIWLPIDWKKNIPEIYWKK